MKQKCQLFGLILILSFIPNLKADISVSERRIFFASPPRSGTHWMMYIVQ